MIWAAWVVSLPRSGSSLTMRLLAAGGLRPFHDEPGSGLDPPPQANPHGFYEKAGSYCHPVETIRGVDGAGRLLKVFAKNVPILLHAGIRPERAVVLRRPIGEITASWDTHFPPLRRAPGEMIANLDAAGDALAADGVPTLTIGFHDLIDHPREVCKEIAGFLGRDMDIDAMAAVPDLALRHFDSRATA